MSLILVFHQWESMHLPHIQTELVVFLNETNSSCRLGTCDLSGRSLDHWSLWKCEITANRRDWQKSFGSVNPPKTMRPPNSGFMLGQRHTRWPNIKVNQHWDYCKRLATSNMRYWFTVFLMVGRRRRRWTSIEITLVQCPVFARYRMSATANNPFKPEFTIVIFIHYKSRIAVAILDL